MGIGLNRLSAGRAATDAGGNDAMEPAADSDAKGPEAEWRTLSKSSAQWLGRWLHLRNLPQDLSWLRSNCLLADGLLKQWMLHCRKKRTRRPCETARSMRVFLIGAGGTGKTTIILELMLDFFCHFFPARPGEKSDT